MQGGDSGRAQGLNVRSGLQRCTKPRAPPLWGGGGPALRNYFWKQALPSLLGKADDGRAAPGACARSLGRGLGRFECGDQILLSTHGPSSLSHHANSRCHVKPQTPEDKAWGPMQYGSVPVHQPAKASRGGGEPGTLTHCPVTTWGAGGPLRDHNTPTPGHSQGATAEATEGNVPQPHLPSESRRKARRSPLFGGHSPHQPSDPERPQTVLPTPHPTRLPKAKLPGPGRLPGENSSHRPFLHLGWS